MSSSNKPTAWILSFLALGVGLAGCQLPSMQPMTREVAPQSLDKGSLRIAIQWPRRDERGLQVVPVGADEAVLLVKDAQEAIRASLRMSREGHAERSSATLDLPAGLGYRLSVSMKGADGEVMASGASTPFDIRPNQATSVPVRLNPIIVSVAGTGVDSHVGEGVMATDAAIQNPSAVGADAAGNFYIAVRKGGSLHGNVIRKVSPEGIITTVVGLPPVSSEAHQSGDDIPARYTLLNSPAGLAVSESGDLFIVDKASASFPSVYRILVVPARDMNRYGKAMKAGHSYTLHETSGTFASVIVAPDGTLYASVKNWVIRVDPEGTSATVAGIDDETLQGTLEDGPATSSTLKTPDGLALDRHGNLFIADRSHHRIRLLCRVPGTYYGIPMQAGWIYSVAGLNDSGAWQRTSESFPYVDGQQGLGSSLNFPRGLAMDDRGNLYIADSTNHLIRRLAPDGKMFTVAGNGKPTKRVVNKVLVVEPLGDGGSSLEATFYNPGGLAIGPRGALYIADSINNLVRRIWI